MMARPGKVAQVTPGSLRNLATRVAPQTNKDQVPAQTAAWNQTWAPTARSLPLSRSPFSTVSSRRARGISTVLSTMRKNANAKRLGIARHKQRKPRVAARIPWSAKNPNLGTAAWPVPAAALSEVVSADGVAPHRLMAPNIHHRPIYRAAMTTTLSPDNCAKPPCESPTRPFGRSCGLSTANIKALRSLTHDALAALYLPAFPAAGGMRL